MNGPDSPSRPTLLAAVPRFARRLIRRYRSDRRNSDDRELFQRNVRPDDVFIVGHPKSGNTWLTYMLAVLLKQDTDHRINISNIGDYAPPLHASDRRIRRYAHLKSPRLFRNEAPRYPELYPRTVYILRDPRSVLLSYYHHCVHDTEAWDWPIGDFIDEMLREGCIARLEPFQVRWDRQVEAWHNRAANQPVKIVRYEDLKRDRRAVLRTLVEFLGLPRDEAMLDMAVARGDFNSMRTEEVKYGAESYPGERGKKGFFVRKGKVNSWAQEMPADVVSRIETAFAEPMQRLGYL